MESNIWNMYFLLVTSIKQKLIKPENNHVSVGTDIYVSDSEAASEFITY